MKKLFYKDKPIIGLDVSQTSIKAMAVTTKGWAVSAYGSIDLDPVKAQLSLEGKDDYLSANILKLLAEKMVGSVNTNHVVMSIPTARTYARTILLPHKAAGNLKDAVSLEVEQYIPVPVSQLYVDFEVIGKSKEGTTVLICAVPQQIVDACVKAAEDAKLQVVMVEPSVNAVARLLTATEEGELPTVIVDIGPALTDIAILDGAVRVTGGVTVGGNTLTLDIAKKLKVPLESAHQLKVLHGLGPGTRRAKIASAIEPNLKHIVTEVKKVIRYYTERIGGAEKLEQVLIVGGGSNIPGIGEYFTNELIMPARVASPWQILNFQTTTEPAKQFKPRYITVAGLASVKPEAIWK